MNKQQRKLLFFVGYILIVGIVIYLFSRIKDYLDQKSKQDKIFNIAMLSAFNSILKTNNSASDWATSFNSLTS